MDRLFSENYASEVSDVNSSTNVVWYLPHFGVVNSNKPGKVRLVFDARHKCEGVSLNDMLLTGPDLLRPLLGILFLFRVGEIAIKGDIRDMFLRVKIRPEDQDAQRFLWRGRDRKSSPRVFKMTSMIFVSKSSPCSANYVKNLNAEGFLSQSPESAAAIKKHTL